MKLIIDLEVIEMEEAAKILALAAEYEFEVIEIDGIGTALRIGKKS